jgi:DNA-binding transcriptional LysR family regulator
LDQFQFGEDSISKSETIVITSLEFMLTHYLSPNLEVGMNCFPDTQLSLVAADRRLSLAYGEADIALRFGRPTEGHLIASKIAEVSFELFRMPWTEPTEWIGLPEDLEWTPEMQQAIAHFGKPPILRVPSYAAARQAAISTGLATIGPSVIMREAGLLESIPNAKPVQREVWSIIHETRRLSQRLAAVRHWIKTTVIETQMHKHNLM